MRVETGYSRREAIGRRVVIDTNVWLSAALSPAGAPAQVVRRVLASGVPVFSDATFAELEARIWKPKFDRYLSMEARRGILHDAHALAHWVGIPADIAAQRFSRDGDDDKFIHTAVVGSALWLVTGDQDLLVIEADMGVRIVAPAQALLMDTFCK
ncbi:putative toxin-antitoxin system toxin component, PIN family [Rhodoferax sp.]|uniref:putative toxin-antitoxin system toxin component, PIN family n=1 Tax=Rhodoferax sp. TaxID=50421 RepID=UPI00276B04C5|nr:putative toxin-antitoxin system toxin component, PIN family [Rhodoferax sp.]